MKMWSQRAEVPCCIKWLKAMCAFKPRAQFFWIHLTHKSCCCLIIYIWILHFKFRSKHRSCYSLIWIQLSSICAEELIAQIFLWSLYETFPLLHLRNEAFVSSADNHGSNSCLSVASSLCWFFFYQVWVWFHLLTQGSEIMPPVSPNSRFLGQECFYSSSFIMHCLSLQSSGAPVSPISVTAKVSPLRYGLFQ